MSETSSQGYQVLARKYRPETFADLVGQDAMVRTLKNAFEADRIAQAFIMTGIRGTGKTTTDNHHVCYHVSTSIKHMDYLSRKEFVTQ